MANKKTATVAVPEQNITSLEGMEKQLDQMQDVVTATDPAPEPAVEGSFEEPETFDRFHDVLEQLRTTCIAGMDANHRPVAHALLNELQSEYENK